MTNTADPGTAHYLEISLLDQASLHEKSNFTVEQRVKEELGLNYRHNVIEIRTNHWAAVNSSRRLGTSSPRLSIYNGIVSGADGFRLSLYLLTWG